MSTEKHKQIQADIERHVAHMAMTHGVKHDDVWNEIYLREAKKVAWTIFGFSFIFGQ